MKQFKDLTFKNHSAGMSCKKAVLHFDNGYGVSVISGPMFYTNGSKPYEVGVLHDGDLCYDTPITSDVIGYLDEDGVTEIMAKVQELKTKENENL